jgi:hypothetical protein
LAGPLPYACRAVGVATNVASHPFRRLEGHVLSPVDPSFACFLSIVQLGEVMSKIFSRRIQSRQLDGHEVSAVLR